VSLALLAVVVTVFVTGAAVLAAAREYTGFGRGLRRLLWPVPPNVAITGVGARYSRERDDDGWVKWGSVVPKYQIHVNQPEGIYDVQTGAENRLTGERVTFPAQIPRIKGDDHVTVRQDDAEIPTSWLDGHYRGESPHHHVLYWATARDERRQHWEFVYDPATDEMRRPRRIRRPGS
jgi:hypothetical protein